MSAAHRYTQTFIASPEHIDELGHVNNSVWVQWVQELATAHWVTAADPADQEQFYWVVIRHEIDYRGNIAEGGSAIGTTFIPEEPKGAKCLRMAEFRDANGKLLVSARTTWAMLHQETGLLARVRPQVLAPFFEEGD